MTKGRKYKGTQRVYTCALIVIAYYGLCRLSVASPFGTGLPAWLSLVGLLPTARHRLNEGVFRDGGSCGQGG